MINRFALSFLCIELDRNEIYEVMLLHILLICSLCPINSIPPSVQSKLRNFKCIDSLKSPAVTAPKMRTYVRASLWRNEECAN